MLEELERRNYAPGTIHAYLRTVEHFARHFRCPPDRLGPEPIRQYQAAMFHDQLASLAEPRSFAAWLRLLFRHDWVVYSKRPFGGPEHALRYVGAYTHRVGIANSRLVALSEGNVSFRWRDSAHGNRKRVMSLPVDEFLRRFLLHLLPRGFVRIRNFAFLGRKVLVLYLDRPSVGCRVLTLHLCVGG
jgi:Putative transposase/Phage integrase, N-terminal SAM-like domain